MRRKVLHSRGTSRDEWHRTTTWKGKRAQELPEERRIREGACVSRQWHSAVRGESLGQRSLKGSSGVESFIAVRFVLPMPRSFQ